MLDTLLQLIGRAHPVLLHLPIGMLAALVALEALALLRAIELHPRARAALAWLVFASAAASVATGLLLAREASYSAGGDTLNLHKWLGIGVAAATLIAAVASTRARFIKVYAVFLLVASAGLLPAGHLGATMTHGEGFLTEPLRRRATPPAGAPTPQPTSPSASGVYSQQIAPIFEQYCYACHSDAKQKGRLALHTPEAILRGGESGAVITPGDPAASEIIRRLRLPADDRDRMPPRTRSQPDEAAIRLIEQWIAAGAPWEGGEPLATEGSATPAADSAPTTSSPSQHAGAPQPPSADAIRALRDHQVHVEVIDPAAGHILVAFADSSSLSDTQAADLLEPVLPVIAELSLSGLRPGAELRALLPRMTQLRTLSLARCGLSPPEFAEIAQTPLTSITDLNLTLNALDDASIVSINRGFPNLRRLTLWNSGLSNAAASILRARNPSLAIQLDATPATPLEVEPELKFSGDAPPPVAPPPPP